MLPFTKRPGRADESGDDDVVTKDVLAVPSPASSTESRAPKAGAAGMRAKFSSMNEDEMTTLMPTKSLGSAVPSPRPAAGAPPPRSALSSRSGGVPSSRASQPASRSGKFAAMDDEEDGRTVVRGAPKIVKRSAGAAPNSAPGSVPPNSSRMVGMPTMPTTISPAAVIKATLESARGAAAGKRRAGGDHLMAGPPSDLLEDLADLHPADVGAQHTVILQSPPVSSSMAGMVQGVKALSTQTLQPQPMPHGTIPPGSARPMSAPPPSMSSPVHGNHSNQSGGYATQSGSYAPLSQSGGYAAPSSQSGGYNAQYNGPVPSGSVSISGVAQSLPAHFMVPQAPYSDARVDPPGTAVTSRMKAGGRPAASWALAVAAFGLFVGVGAVAVMNGNSGEGVRETTASFVDPSRAGAAKAAAAAQPGQAAPTPVPVTDPALASVPPVAVPAAAPPTDVVAPAAVPPVVAAAPPAAVAAAPAAAAPAAPKLAAPVAVAAAPAAAPVARPAPAPRTFRPAAPPADEKETTAAAPTKTKPPKTPKGGGDVDEETKKALEALQKSQLESSF